jgi:electron transport complex protein RnfE
MTDTSYRELSLNGLWKNNPAIVQLLGLCPLLAVTGSVVNALGPRHRHLLRAAHFQHRRVADSQRHRRCGAPADLRDDHRRGGDLHRTADAGVQPIELYEVLGIFLPLITTNCVILGRADGFARKHALLPSMYDGLMMGLGFTWCCWSRRAARAGRHRRLFANMDLLFGPRPATGRWCCSATTSRSCWRSCRRRIYLHGADHRAEKPHRRADRASRGGARPGGSRQQARAGYRHHQLVQSVGDTQRRQDLVDRRVVQPPVLDAQL